MNNTAKIFEQVKKASIDFPRPIRISSGDQSLDAVRDTLRRNKVAHLDFNPSLENLKSRLLLDGVYKPNVVSTEADSSKLATEFIKESKNYRCENFTISDIYGAAMKEALLKKQLAYEKKLLSMVRPITDEER